MRNMEMQKSSTSTLLGVPGTEHIIRITNVIDMGIILNRRIGYIMSLSKIIQVGTESQIINDTHFSFLISL
jgi:hypothetical protein